MEVVKALLMTFLIGLHEPVNGKIKINDIDLQGVRQNWAKNVSYLSQSYFIFNDSIKNNITLDFSEKKIDQNFYNDCIKKTGIEEFIKTLPKGDDTQVIDFGRTYLVDKNRKLPFLDYYIKILR